MAQGLTLLENKNESFHSLVMEQNIPSHYTVGITGPPGAGKSTLIEALLQQLAEEEKIAVLASDPSSPFSGGALLGDRYRLSNELSDNVYYRSLASRGSRGSMAAVCRNATRLLALAGYNWVIYETIGAGQNEWDVQSLSQCIVLVLVPESGDTTQAMKAGVLELADIIVINKMDRPGAEHFRENLESTMNNRAHHRNPEWTRRFISCIASERQGVDSLTAALKEHRQHCLNNKASEGQKIRISNEIKDILLEQCQQQLETLSAEQWQQLINDFQKNKLNPRKFLSKLFDIK